jgi:hypothetical protein
MSAMLSAVILALCLSVCAQAQVRTLAVVPAGNPALDSISSVTLQNELNRLLAPAGVDATWRPAVQDQFELLVVASFSGECAATELPARAQSGRLASVLGESEVTRSGRILPFLRVDCATIVQTLAPFLRPLGSPQRNAVLGRALARVMAHEIYHILSQGVGHGGSGAAKASFSAHDLLAARFDFDGASLSRMAARVVPFAQIAGASLSRE